MPLTTHDPIVMHTHTDTEAAHAAPWRTDLEAAVRAHLGHHGVFSRAAVYKHAHTSVQQLTRKTSSLPLCLQMVPACAL